MCLLLLTTAYPAGSDPPIAPPDVHAMLMLLHQELELVRYEMGKPRRLEGMARIAGVAPREVYFQALTLFRKANRLSFEHTREVVHEAAAASSLLADTPDTVGKSLKNVDTNAETIPLERCRSRRARGMRPHT